MEKKTEKPKTIYDIELHESLSINEQLHVIRVHNGWIYQVRIQNESGKTVSIHSDFVPYEPPNVDVITDVHFESVDELTRKKADAFDVLQTYFISGLKQDSPFSHEDVKGAFQSAYQIAELGTTLNANVILGVPFEQENERQKFNPSYKAQLFFEEHGVCLAPLDIEELFEKVKEYNMDNEYGIYYDELYSFIKHEHGVGFEYDEMATLIKICNGF